MTLYNSLGQADIQSDVPPGRDIWWPRAVLHKVIMASVGEVSHTMQCRRYELLKIEQFM